MSPTPGQRIGPYEITASVGAGGMGEVYRARDTTLNRDVAIKVLPELFAADPERLARFTREAQTLAALNHPNIAQIYGVVDQALIMEFAGGDDLSTIIARGPLPVADALAIARQIGDALEAAHEQGIVHRDLKPANIKVKADGTVKVLDFGLAKAMDPASAGPEGPAYGPGYGAMNSPTFTAQYTQLGVVLGTAAYMAPEQAKGKTVDKRADIWAFGVVLFEMLTGRQTFAGDTISEVMAAVMKDDPDWTQLPPLPPEVLRLLRRCLLKDPRQRLRDIGEARVLFSQPQEPPAAGSARAVSLARAAAAVAIVFAVLTSLAVWQLKKGQTVPLRRFELSPEITAARDVALAPDGSGVAYVAAGHMYVREFASLEPRDLGAVPPANQGLSWSPDGRSIAFAAQGALQRMSLDGGPAFTICAIPATSRIMDAAWLADGTVVFAVWRDSLYKVAASGGTPAVLLQVDLKTEVDFHRVSPLPDGRLIVQTHQRNSDADIVEILDGARRTTLSSDRTALDFQYGGPGRVLFLRESINPGLWSAPFNGTTADLNKAVLIQAGAKGFDVARDGTLLERLPEVSRQSLQWLDRKGGILPAAGEPIDDMNSASVAVSPDGHRVAFITGDGPSANLFVRDLQSGADTALTFRRPDAAHAGTWTSIYTPSWLPSSDRLLHTAGITAALKIVEGRADAAGDERELATGADAIVSNDGRMLVFKTDAMDLNRLRRAPLLPGGSVGPVEPVFSKAADPIIGQFDLSPDGRLLAYSARDENGAFEVYVTDFPAVSGRLLVTKGGTRPRFSRVGELFYIKGTVDAAGRPKGELMSVQVKEGPPIALGASERLLSDDGPATNLVLSGFSVAPDGRLLIPTKLPPAPGREARLVVVQNWPALLERRPVP